LLNRNEEFSRCKEGNLSAVQAAIREGKIACRYQTSIDHLDRIEAKVEPMDMERTMMMSVVDLSKQ
jgi:hypothetical protein